MAITARITVIRAELTETPIRVNIAGIAERAMTATTTAMSTRIQKEEVNINKKVRKNSGDSFPLLQK